MAAPGDLKLEFIREIISKHFSLSSDNRGKGDPVSNFLDSEFFSFFELNLEVLVAFENGWIGVFGSRSSCNRWMLIYFL